MVAAAVVAAASLGVVTAPLSGRHPRPGPGEQAGDEGKLTRATLAVSVESLPQLSAAMLVTRHVT